MARDEYHIWWGPIAEWAFTLLWLLLWAWRSLFDNCRIGPRSRS